MLFFEYLQNRESGGARYRIAAEGAEEFHSIIETCGDFRSGDDCSKREGIADRFAEHHDVRNDSLRLESPEVRAEAAKADLHFIGDADATCGANVLVGFREISGRKNNLTGDARHSLGDVRSRAAAFSAHSLQQQRDVLRVVCSRCGIIPPVWTAIIVRNCCDMDPRLAAAASRSIKLVRAQVDECCCMPVVCVFEDDDILAGGVRAGQAQRKLVRFAAGVHEIADAQRLRQKTREALGVTVHVVV